MSVEFIDAHRQEFGVEPICTALQIAPSTYYAAKKRPLSARAVRDAVMVQILMVLWSGTARFGVTAAGGCSPSVKTPTGCVLRIS